MYSPPVLRDVCGHADDGAVSDPAGRQWRYFGVVSHGLLPDGAEDLGRVGAVDGSSALVDEQL